MAVGGFPCDVIFGEDTVTAAKFLLAGWKIVYAAKAQVITPTAIPGRRILNATSILVFFTLAKTG